MTFWQRLFHRHEWGSDMQVIIPAQSWVTEPPFNIRINVMGRVLHYHECLVCHRFTQFYHD